MQTIKREGVLLSATDLYFENGGVLNPAVYQDGNTVHLFYRGMQSGGTSMIGACSLDGPVTLAHKRDEPVIVPEYAYEAFGVEDPRIVKIDDAWYMTYTAWDGRFALGSIAISSDLDSFTKTGPIFPRWTYDRFYEIASRDNVDPRYFSYEHNSLTPLWSKNMVFFPKRIGGKLVLLHRIRPGILLVEFDEIAQLTEDFWLRYFKEMGKHVVLDPVHPFESHILGAGCPPVETKEGWLLIYHGVTDTDQGYSYAACAALLDPDNPRKVIGRLSYPLLLPEEPWEKYGNARNVVFPTGTALFGDRLYIYYGAGDACTAAVSLDINELLYELKTSNGHRQPGV